jgi:glycosyltransferase involved in cell wall biosynthesis
MPAPTLSVIIPAYNEAATIAEVLDAVMSAPFAKQVIVVDDGSRDGTLEALRAWLVSGRGDVEVVCHPRNLGKGASIRTGLARCRGEVTLVQDADLEYDPGDYPKLVDPILRRDADAVYGSRYLEPSGPVLRSPHLLCVRFLNLMVRLLYGFRTTDEATCYKAFRTDLLRRMDLRCMRFEFCPEVTAKACLMGLEIREVPVRYRPRSYAQGKKIGWWDGIEAIATLLRWRFVRFRPAGVVDGPAAACL